jgi:antitoxin VapB
MYIDDVHINIRGVLMALQIANPQVIGKVERLAKATGLSKTAVVERALDRLLTESAAPAEDDRRLKALLKQLDQITELAGATDPLEWDANGLPK